MATNGLVPELTAHALSSPPRTASSPLEHALGVRGREEEEMLDLEGEGWI